MQPQLFFDEMAEACQDFLDQFALIKTADRSDPRFEDAESDLYLKLAIVKVKAMVLDEEIDDAMVAESEDEGRILDLLFAQLDPGETEEDTVFSDGERAWEADLVLRTSARVYLIEVCHAREADGIRRAGSRLAEGLRVHRAAHPGEAVEAVLIARRGLLSPPLRRELDVIDGLTVYAVDDELTTLTQMRVPRPVD